MKSESGNVLWFILIGVVLLGLLTMVLSRSGSTVDQSGDIEQQRVKVSQILRTAKSIEAAVQEMRLRGVSENDMSFQNPTTAVNYTNANCTTTDCRVFESGGAGLTYTDPPTGVNDGSEWIFNATNNVADIETTSPELLLILPNVRTSVCAQINRMLGSTYGGLETNVDFTAFTGTYAATEAIDLADGQEAGCIDYDNAGTTEPFFYHVLIKR